MNKTSFWYRLVHLNPALFRGLIMAVVLLLAAVGVKVSPAIPDATIGFLAALFALIQALWTAPAVTPNEKVVVYVPDPVKAPDEVAPGQADAGLATNSEIIKAARTAPASDDPLNY